MQTHTDHNNAVIIPDGADLSAHASAASGLSLGEQQYTEIPIDEVAERLRMEDPEFTPDYSGLSRAARETQGPYLPEDADETEYDEDSSGILRSVSDDLGELQHPRRFSVDPAPSTTADEFEFDLGDVAAPPKPGRLAAILRPAGRVNRRLIAIITISAIALFVIVFTSTRQPTRQSLTGNAANQGPDQNTDAPIRVNPAESTLRSPEYVGPQGDDEESRAAARRLGMEPMPDSTPMDANASRASILNITNPHPGVAPAYPTSSQPSIASQDSGLAGLGQLSQNYAVAMRGAKTSPVAQITGMAQTANVQAQNILGAGTETKPETSEANAKPNAKIVRLPQSTRIAMTLLEPLQSGMAATADARIDSDVRSATGEILLRAGSTVSIPFLPIHTNGRMSAAPAEIKIQLADGRTLAMKGTVKGQDGLMGLPGKITKKGTGSTLGRVARGIARTGVQAGQRVLGEAVGSTGYIDSNNIDIGDAVSERYGTSYGYDRAPKEIVDVPSGIRFQFIVLQ